MKKSKENYDKIASIKEIPKKVLSYKVFRVGLQISYSLRQYLRTVSERHSGNNLL